MSNVTLSENKVRAVSLRLNPPAEDGSPPQLDLEMIVHSISAATAVSFSPALDQNLVSHLDQNLVPHLDQNNVGRRSTRFTLTVC